MNTMTFDNEVSKIVKEKKETVTTEVIDNNAVIDKLLEAGFTHGIDYDIESKTDIEYDCYELRFVPLTKEQTAEYLEDKAYLESIAFDTEGAIDHLYKEEVSIEDMKAGLNEYMESLTPQQNAKIDAYNNADAEIMNKHIEWLENNLNALYNTNHWTEEDRKNGNVSIIYNGVYKLEELKY